MTDFAPLPVFPNKYVSGTSSVIDEGPPGRSDRGILTDVGTALTNAWETDAHFGLYTLDAIEDVDFAWRLKKSKSALPELAERGAEPKAHWLAIDLDNPDHREWTDEDKKRLQNLAQRDGQLNDWLDEAFTYSTLHGWRALWPLQFGMEVSKFESLVEQFLIRLKDHGLGDHFDLDESCTDWTRLFRLPCVNREGEGRVYPDILADLDPEDARPLSYTPTGLESKYSSDYGSDASGFEPDQDPLDAMGAEQEDLRLARAALEQLDPDMPYEEWMMVGMALKEKFHDGGFHLWDTWSQQGDKYDAAEMPNKWQSFSVGGQDGVTFASLIHAMNEEFEDWRPNPTRAVKDDDYEEALATLQEHVDVPEGQNPEKFLILYDRRQCGKTFWAWNESEACYEYPASSGGAFRDVLDRACPTLLQGRHINPETGRRRGVEFLTSNFGSPVRDSYAELGHRGVRYDARTQSVYEGMASVDPDLEPTYHERVHTWLVKLGHHRSEELLDWLATFLQFDRPTCALYINGPNSTGKSMLTQGLARLFSEPTPVPWADAMDSFNAKITNCPLVVADEQVPDNFFQEDESQLIKRFLGQSGMTINEKFTRKKTLLGVPRLMITANDKDALAFQENVSEQTRRAIEKRMGYIETDDQARQYLEQLGGYKTTRSWVDGGKIAEHVLWLQENRDVELGPRFLVEGWKSKLTTAIGTRHGLTGKITATLIQYIMDGGGQLGQMPFGSEVRQKYRDEGIYIQVNVNALRDAWSDYSKSPESVIEEASNQQITDALKPLATDDHKGQQKCRIKTRKGNRVRVWNLSVDALVRNAKAWNLYGPEQLMNALEVQPEDRKRLMDMELM